MSIIDLTFDDEQNMLFWLRAQKIRPTGIREDIHSGVRVPLYIVDM